MRVLSGQMLSRAKLLVVQIAGSFQPNQTKLSARMNFGDLRSLQAKPGHQTLLPESKGINAFSQRRASHRLSHAGVHYDQTWPAPDLPSAALVQVGEVGIVHEK